MKISRCSKWENAPLRRVQDPSAPSCWSAKAQPSSLGLTTDQGLCPRSAFCLLLLGVSSLTEGLPGLAPPWRNWSLGAMRVCSWLTSGSCRVRSGLLFSSWLWGEQPDSSRWKSEGPLGAPRALFVPRRVVIGKVVGNPEYWAWGPSDPSAIPCLPWASVLTLLLLFKPCLLSKRGFIFTNYFLY